MVLTGTCSLIGEFASLWIGDTSIESSDKSCGRNFFSERVDECITDLTLDVSEDGDILVIWPWIILVKTSVNGGKTNGKEIEIGDMAVDNIDKN